MNPLELFEENRDEEAFELFEKLIASSRGEQAYGLLVMQGRCHAVSGDFEAAKHDYDRALAMKQHDERAHLIRGMILLQLKDGEGAERDFLEVKELRKEKSCTDSYTSHLDRHMGKALVLQGRFDDALVWYNEAIELEGEDMELMYLERGEILTRLKRADEAQRDFSAAVAIEPSLRQKVEEICNA